MATQPIPITRTLPAIVCDLATTRQRLACVNARGSSEQCGREWDALTDRLWALEAEFDAAFFAEHGVAFSLASAARNN